MFDEIVEQCSEKGLVSGKHLTVDSTLVKANVSFKTLEPIVVSLRPAKLPGSRVFADRFMAIEQALGIPKGHDDAAKYLRAFIEDVKASGFVARAIERAGVTGVSVPGAVRRG